MADFDPNVPSVARVNDYFLGGKDNFASDRELGARLIALLPSAQATLRENKKYLRLAVTWAAKQGIRQFIDLGAGMPTSPSTHETARAVAPGARVAYVDNDAVALSHLEPLAARGNSRVTVIDGDIRDSGAVLHAVAEGIDLTEPACLITGSLLYYFTPEYQHSPAAEPREGWMITGIARVS